MTRTVGYLVIEYTPDRDKKSVGGKIMGVHTPLRQDGVYSDLERAQNIADNWSQDRMHPHTNIVVAEIKSMNRGRR